MILALLQPVFIPDLQDIATMLATDLILLDDREQWSRKSRVHRAVIRAPEGTQYINIPIRTTDKKKPIKEIRIDHSDEWIVPMLKSLEFNYRNSVYFDFYEPEIRADIESGQNYEYLLPFALHIRSRIFRYLELDLDDKIELMSNRDFYDSDPDQMAENFGASQYYQEHDARHYQRQGKNRLELPFKHPKYRQHFEGFEPDCCVLDLLFQYGPESFRVLDGISRAG